MWVVDSPRGYSTWAFDELAGLKKETLAERTDDEDEVFGAANRKMMSESLQLARKWASQVEAALASPSPETSAVVARWFHTSGASKSDISSTIATLLAGFKKIHSTCNSNSVIFFDRPHLRSGGKYDNTYASVNSGDAMPVIYIYELFLKTGRRTLFGNIPKLWLCALTVVHELSHKLVRTEDIRYDYDGLAPSTTFTPEKALKNADSWAYFAADLVGAVSASTVKKVCV